MVRGAFCMFLPAFVYLASASATGYGSSTTSATQVFLYMIGIGNATERLSVKGVARVCGGLRLVFLRVRESLTGIGGDMGLMETVG